MKLGNLLTLVTTIVFFTLKLCGFIDWSWWLVTAPLWGSFWVVAICLALIREEKGK